MIKYDVTSVHTVEQLVVLDKLKSVKGVDKVINKYNYGENYDTIRN